MTADLTIAAIEVPRWSPNLIVSDLVTPSPQVGALGYRSPARFTAPEIHYHAPQPLFVTGDKFTIVTERSGLVPDSTYLFDEYAWQDLFLPPRTIVATPDRPILVASNAAWINYSHWLFQCLSPILLARDVGLADVDALIAPLRPIHREYLALAGVEPARLIELPAGTAALPAQGIYSNLTSGDYPFRPHPAIIGAFEDLAERAPKSALAGRRIFLSRADTRNRPMTNEAALRDELAAQGFAIVTAGTLSAQEQIALFRDAALIVGPHGAAMTNLLFAPQGEDGPIVVELHQENFLGAAFLKICQVKRLHYTAIVSRMVDPGADGRHDSNWEADLPLIRKTLAAL
jgi:capsular polysaccharide biosynthesis protein